MLHSSNHAAPRGLVSRFSLLRDFGNYCKVCRLQARIDSIPIADSPHPPQPPAATFKRLYRTRARASCSRLTLRRKRASDRALTFLRRNPSWVGNAVADSYLDVLVVRTTANYLVFGLAALGCSAQTWAANSLSRRAAYFCFISSRDSPAGGPEGLNTQLHSEQPKP